MIRLKNVGFSYRKVKVLQKIDLSFPRGELCAIVGPNGCGKTTLLKLLSRLLVPDAGEIFLDEGLYMRYDRKVFAQRISLMPQTRPVPEMTVGEYAANGRYPYLQFSQKLTLADENAVLRAMQAAGIEQFAQRSLRELSGGERQRAYLALLMAQDTDYALLDEPTTYLDISAQFSVMQILRKMRDSGKCVITVLHDLSLAMQYCDRIVIMQNGSVVAVDSPATLSASDVWQAVFGVRCVPIDQNGTRSYIFQPIK